MNPRLLFASVLMLSIALVPLASSANPLIQEEKATPEVGESASFPVEIHAGSCGHYEPDAIIRLSDLTAVETDADSEAVPAATSFSTIETSLDELLDEPYVVVVHESASTMNSVLVCGAIGGRPGERGLAVGLHSVSADSNISGVAWLTSSEGQTQVSVFLTKQPALSAAIEVPVTLGGNGKEFTIATDLTTFRVGQLYRFVVTNEGAIPHEFVIGQSLGNLQHSEEGQGEDMHMDDDEDMHMDGENASTSADHELVHDTSLALIEADDLPSGATVSVDVVFDEPTNLGDLEFACHVPGHYDAGMFLPIEVVSAEAD